MDITLLRDLVDEINANAASGIFTQRLILLTGQVDQELRQLEAYMKKLETK